MARTERKRCRARCSGEDSFTGNDKPNEGYICTRQLGHTGDHVAHGPGGEAIWSWQNTQGTERP